MSFRFNIITKFNIIFKKYKKKSNLKWELFSFSLKNNKFIFINENFFFSYINILIFIYNLMKSSLNIIILDVNKSYQKFFFFKLKKTKIVTPWLKGLLSNSHVVKYFHIRKQYPFLNKTNHLIITFDLIKNLEIVEEARKQKLPVICFYNQKLTSTNLYKLKGSSTLRTFYFLLCTFYIIHNKIKNKLHFYTYAISINPAHMKSALNEPIENITKHTFVRPKKIVKLKKRIITKKKKKL